MSTMDLQRARESVGITKSELARRLDIPVRNVRRMENTDGYDPRFSRVVEIADALGVCVDSLVRERAHGRTLSTEPQEKPQPRGASSPETPRGRTQGA